MSKNFRRLWEKLGLNTSLLDKDEVKQKMVSDVEKGVSLALVLLRDGNENKKTKAIEVLKRIVETYSTDAIRESVDLLRLKGWEQEIFDGLIKLSEKQELGAVTDERMEQMEEYPVQGLDPTNAITAAEDNEKRWDEEVEESGGYLEGGVYDVPDGLNISNENLQLIQKDVRDFIQKTEEIANQAEVSSIADLESIKNAKKIAVFVDRQLYGLDGSDWSIPSKRDSEAYKEFSDLISSSQTPEQIRRIGEIVTGKIKKTLSKEKLYELAGLVDLKKESLMAKSVVDYSSSHLGETPEGFDNEKYNELCEKADLKEPEEEVEE